MSSGGASFSPRLSPRPLDKYPPLRDVAYRAILANTWLPALCVMVVLAVEPLYTGSVVHFQEKIGGAGGWFKDPSDHDRLFFVVSFITVKVATSLLCHGFFFVIEWFRWFDCYKLDRRPVQFPALSIIIKNLRDLFIGNFVTAPLLLWHVLYPIFKWCGSPPFDSSLGDLSSGSTGLGSGVMSIFPKLWTSFFWCFVLNDWGFYWTHRLLHHRWFYKKIHKQHHTYKATVSYAAEYAHPIEIVLSNYIPTLAGLVLTAAHPLVVLVWIAVRLERTYESHSGYCFKGTLLDRIGVLNSEAAAWHDYHHTKNHGNFGAAYIDWIFGTMDSYVEAGGTEVYSQVSQKADDRHSYITFHRNGGSEKRKAQ